MKAYEKLNNEFIKDIDIRFEEEVNIECIPYPHISFEYILKQSYNKIVTITIVRDALVILDSYVNQTMHRDSWWWILKFSGLFLNDDKYMTPSLNIA